MSDQHLVPVPTTVAPLPDPLTSQLAPSSVRLYQHDIAAFRDWMVEHDLAIETITHEHVWAYRDHLVATYAKATARRMLSVMRRVIKRALVAGITSEPYLLTDLRGIRDDNATTHIALSEAESLRLVESIDQATLSGKRDYALIWLLIRLGLRRQEVCDLTIGSLQRQQGFHTLVVYGKGDKRRIMKIPDDVALAIQDYLTTRPHLAADQPLFVGVRRNRGETTERHRTQAMTGSSIAFILARRALAVGLTKDREGVNAISPHDLRTTFITLALMNQAPLHKVQYAAGHADPRTTERYDRNRDNLEDNAVDYLFRKKP